MDRSEPAPDEPDEVQIEEAQEDPLEGLEFIDEPIKPETLNAQVETTPLMDLETAVEQVPAALRKEMEDLLRAEFREVIRWKPGSK